MSINPAEYVNSAVMAGAFAADAILSALLVFLWLAKPKEKHALCWGVAQMAVMGGIMAWFVGVDYLPHQLRLFICALMLTGGMFGFLAGTLYFLGDLHRRHVRWLLIGGVLNTALFYLLWNLFYNLVAPGSAFTLGWVMLWMGWRLARGQSRYRWLGVTMLARGGFNVVTAIILPPPLYLLWFAGTALLKALSMVGLIYAVQDEIEQRFVRTVDSLSHGFLIRDKRGYVHVANERCARLLGFNSTSELIGKHVSELIPGLSRAAADDYFSRFAADGVQYPMTETAIFTLHNGSRLPIEMMASPYIERGRLYCLVQLLDISERKKKDDLLYKAARIDPVTGFFNRDAVTTLLAQEVNSAAQAGRECAVLFLDLDKFKRINDSFGHAAGDDVLRQTAHRLYGVLRPDDTLARFGGDEFIIVMPDLDPGTSAAVASQCGARVLEVMASHFALAQHTVGASASIGVACYPGDGADSASLIRHADIAMYEAKKAGRGELRFFNDGMNAAAKEALVIDGALRGAIEAHELRLLYQPIVDARSGQLVKVEALLRWNNARLGEVFPDRFIPVAEESGMIVAIGNWVLDEACRQAAQWRQGALSGLAISINVSAWQLADPAFVSLVEQALARHGVSGHQLELELTERVLIDDGGHVQAVLERLRVLGVSISLDDFGTGYSSLSYLTRFRLNTLKIDRAFVMNIEDNERSNKLVQAIVTMGHSLGLQLVAEGVETAGQAAILQRAGCQYLQGYHIARPLAPVPLQQFAEALLAAAAAPA